MRKSSKAPVFDAKGYQVNLTTLNGTLLPDLKRGAAWKKETARRLDEMAAGKKVSVAKLRRQLSHV
jgi:hypothetical protein